MRVWLRCSDLGESVRRAGCCQRVIVHQTAGASSLVSQRGSTGWGAVSKSEVEMEGLDRVGCCLKEWNTHGLDRMGCCLEEWNGHRGVRVGGVLSRRVEWTHRG